MHLFSLQCLNDEGRRTSSVTSSSPRTFLHPKIPKLSKCSDSTSVVNGPYDISEYERTNYYNGISPNPPKLFYRSDLLDNPFPTPKGSFPTKTVHGVFDTPLNLVWETAAPQIRDVLKARGIRYSAIKVARFSTTDDEGMDRLGPVVIWITVRPGSTTTEGAHHASALILDLLRTYDVEGVVVEWYEGVVERL